MIDIDPVITPDNSPETRKRELAIQEAIAGEQTLQAEATTAPENPQA